MASNTEKRDVIITLQGGQALHTIEEMQVAMRKLRKEFREAATEGKRKEVAAEMKKLNEELSKQYALTRAAGGAHKQLTQQMQSGFAKMTASAKAAGGQILAALGITALAFQFVNGIRSAISTAKNFEAQMDKVRAVSRAADVEMVELEKSARNLGATTMFTATQVAELQEEYARLGFTVNEILRATPATLALAAATGESLADSAKIAGSTIRGFQMDASETGRVADVMALSFSKSALNLSDFGETMKYVAPIAKAANIDIETTTALMGKLADAGLRGTMAGTGLRNILSKLSDENSDLSKELGFSVKNSDDLFRAFQELKKGNIDLTKATELTDERAKAAFITLVNGIDTVEDLKSALDDAAGSAQQMAEIMQDNFEGSVTRMKSAWEGFVLTVTQTDSLRGATDWLTKIITGWTYLLGGLEDNAALQETMATIASNFKETRLDQLASGYKDMDDILGEMATRMMDINTQTKEYSELQQQIRQIQEQGNHVPAMMEKELEDRQKQLDLDRQYVRVLAEIRDEKEKADQTAATELAAEFQSIMADMDKLGAEMNEQEKKRLEELAKHSKELFKQLQDAKLDAIDDVEQRSIAAAKLEYERRKEEIEATKADEEVKNELLEQLYRNFLDQKAVIHAEATQKRIEEEARQVQLANDSELLTLQLRVDVAEEGSMEQLDAYAALLQRQMEIELDNENLSVEQKELIQRDYINRLNSAWDDYYDWLKNKGEEQKKWEDMDTKERAAAISGYLDQVESLWNSMTDAISNMYSQQLQEAEQQQQTQLAQAEEDLQNGVITQEEFEQRKFEIKERFQEKERSLKRAQFETERAAAIGQGMISIAQGILVAIEQGGPLAAFTAALVTAMGIAQIAAISNEPNPYYAGGLTGIRDSEGNRHMARNVGSLAGGGYYSTPSYGVVAERGPELVIPNWLLNAPEFSNPIAELEGAIARGYATGGRTSATASQAPSFGNASSSSAQSGRTDAAFMALLANTNALLSDLKQNGIRATALWDFQKYLDGVMIMEDIDNKKYLVGDENRKPGQKF